MVLEHIVILSGPFWRKPARTDADGRFVLRGVSLAQIPIRIFKLGFEQRLDTYSDAFKSGERYTLARAPVGRATIEAADGGAVPRLRAFHWYPELSQGHVSLRSAVESWHLEAQPDGRVLLALDERMRVVPSKMALLFEDGSLALVGADRDSQRSADASERGAARLHGAARPADRDRGAGARRAGAPVAGAKVAAGFDADQVRDEAAEAASAVSDAAGRYEMRGLAVGKYLVFGPGPRSGERGAKAETELGKLREGIDVVAAEGCEVFGNVTVGGRPAGFATVAAYADKSTDFFARRIARTVADAKGNYRIVGVPPGRAILFARSFEETAGPAARARSWPSGSHRSS